MSEKREFSFGDNSVAKAYDQVLVPILFEPWAAWTVEQHVHCEGQHVLDLASGTGVIAKELSTRVGGKGKVIATDINPEMLNYAKARLNSNSHLVEFIESPAYPLKVESDSIDFVICQQGFQFFPERKKAVEEIYRVLKNNGNVFISTWCSVDECEYFGAICDALDQIGKSDISEMMGVPFNFMTKSELVDHFEKTGFAKVELKEHCIELVIEGGMDDALRTAYATPIGPKLKELPDDEQEKFKLKLKDILNKLSPDGKRMGRMVTNIVTAKKSA